MVSNGEIKTCTKCNLTKKIDCFHRCVSNKDGYKNICKRCICLYAKEYGQKNKEKIRQTRVKRIEQSRKTYLQKRRGWYRTNKNKALTYIDDNKVGFIYRQAKRRAKERGLDFSITKNDIIIPTFCPILEIKISTNNRTTAKHSSPSLDRINNCIGYTKSNTRIISYRANTIKNDATKDEIKEIISFIENFNKYEPVSFQINKEVEKRLKRMIRDARYRAKKLKLDFTINFDDIKKLTVNTCPILNLPIDWTLNKRSDNSPSLERIDSKQGYTPSNVAIISWRANRIKKDATIQELKLIFEKAY